MQFLASPVSNCEDIRLCAGSTVGACAVVSKSNSKEPPAVGVPGVVVRGKLAGGDNVVNTVHD